MAMGQAAAAMAFSLDQTPRAYQPSVFARTSRTEGGVADGKATNL